MIMQTYELRCACIVVYGYQFIVACKNAMLGFFMALFNWYDFIAPGLLWKYE